VCGGGDDAAGRAAAAVANLSLLPDADCKYDELSGIYNNSRFNAPNVWSVDVPPLLVAEAAATFERCGLRAAYKRLDTTNPSGEEVICSDGERFFATHAGWKSDVAWLSADDQATHDTFLSLFRRMGVAEKFGPIVGDRDGNVHLYSAFFVVRTHCSAHDIHVDYGPKVKTRALTLMTPLYEEYAAVEDFQLLYIDHDKAHRRYRYHLGEAVVFGADFQHSTEPGTAALEPTAPGYKRDPASGPAPSSEQAAMVARQALELDVGCVEAPTRPPAAPSDRRAHVYLCFAFGSNEEEIWGAISETVDGNQSRQISKPSQLDGANQLSLSKLGLRLASGIPHNDGQHALPPEDVGKWPVAERWKGHSTMRRRLPRGMLK